MSCRYVKKKTIQWKMAYFRIKTIPRIFIFSDGATRIVTKRTGEDRKRDEASWGRKGYCSAV